MVFFSSEKSAKKDTSPFHLIAFYTLKNKDSLALMVQLRAFKHPWNISIGQKGSLVEKLSLD